MKKLLLVGLLLGILVTPIGASPASAGRQVVVMMDNDSLCIKCKGAKDGLWMQQGSRYKIRLRCEQVGRAWRKKGRCPEYVKETILLEGETLLIVKGGGVPRCKLQLFTSYWAGNMFWAYCFE